jgi:SAM-dependent methyltransferase
MDDCEDDIFRYLVCDNCGFVFSSPRPTDEDMAIKYQKIIEYKTTELSPLYNRSFDNTKRRSVELRKLLEQYRIPEGLEILDFGGAEGKILSAMAHDNACFVVDFEKRKLAENVVYLGQSLSDLGGRTFDVITACHVLEHLVAPKEFVAQVRDSLKTGGLLYIEVPMELRKNYAGHGDFITHVNVFSARTLREFLARYDFSVLEVVVGHKPNNNGWELVAYALAKAGKSVDAPVEPRHAYDTSESLASYWLVERLKGRMKYEFYKRFDKMRSSS